MKYFISVLTNSVTGDIEHCATSDSPIPDELLPTVEGVSYIIDKFEAHNVDVPDLINAREVLNNIERIGATPAEKLAASITLKGAADVNRFKNFSNVPDHVELPQEAVT